MADKTKSVAHETDLPDDLVAVLVKSFEAHPRRFLILSPESGKPYIHASAYAQYVTRVFSSLLGKHTTVNSLRHSFSSQLDLNTLTPKQRKEIAEALMHSPEMTHRYRYVNVEGASTSSSTSTSTSIPARCQLVCTKGRKASPTITTEKEDRALIQKLIRGGGSGVGGAAPTKAERYRAATAAFARRIEDSAISTQQRSSRLKADSIP